MPSTSEDEVRRILDHVTPYVTTRPEGTLAQMFTRELMRYSVASPVYWEAIEHWTKLCLGCYGPNATRFAAWQIRDLFNDMDLDTPGHFNTLLSMFDQKAVSIGIDLRIPYIIADEVKAADLGAMEAVMCRLIQAQNEEIQSVWAKLKLMGDDGRG